ncbi:CinA family protein [Novosphingobium cyanobacteriorum]|uniref:CinA family protein n=1 Tax=Novosphingobium cyanobacteriorum TaxID=3024215 RepID=A0ABT6CJ04_9SPHN|nr:CinA family protein [Novosphingobium cyanobacteriorum]MDF8333881.1 CinA family protein [Novosphingobium cyanobacteriorum]
MMFEDLAAIGIIAGEALKARRQTIAVVDGATGGLISAGLIATPGATGFFRGGGVIYTLDGRRIMLGHEPGSLRGYTSATESYALVQADLIRRRFGADWGMAESGSAGPNTHPMGVPSGTSAIGLVGPDGFETAITVRTESTDRVANMQAFAKAALELLRNTLA